MLPSRLVRRPHHGVMRALVTAMSLLLSLGGAIAVPTPVAAASPVTITNSGSPNPVTSGTQLTYTIVVTNTGGSKLTSLNLSDQVNGLAGLGVPPQLVLTSSAGSCGQNNFQVTCSVASLAGGATWTTTIRGVVTAAGGTTLDNTATVAGTRSSTTFTSSATASVLVSSSSSGTLADLTINKNGPSTVAASSPMSYTLTVNNVGSLNATGVEVVDTVPTGVTGISATGTNLFTCSVSGQTVDCTGGAVNAGMNATITVKGTSPGTTTSITNTAVVDPNGTIPENSYLNNQSQAVVTSVTAPPPPSALTIGVTHATDPIVPGSIITYTVSVKNVGTARADNVVVTDGTQGLNASSITAAAVVTSGNAPSCTISAPKVTCSTTHWYPGGTFTITIKGQVTASAGSTLLDTATVNANVSNKGVSYSASDTTIVHPAYDLTITKTAAPNPVCARSWPGGGGRECTGGLTYTFVVGNAGVLTADASVAAGGVVVRDPLPAGVVFDSFTAPAFSGGCTVDGSNVVTCSGGSIAGGTTATIIIVTVAPPTTGSITNTATVDPNNTIPESDETNNTASVTTTVSTGIDLRVQKYDSGVNDPAGFDPIATSGTETYVLKVDDLGPQDASNIEVRDTLPAGMTFRSATTDGTHNFTCSYASGVVDCVGGSVRGTASAFYPHAPFNLGADVATITITAFAQPIVGTMHNVARVNPTGAIPEIDAPTLVNDISAVDTAVVNGGASKGAFNDLTIGVAQSSPSGNVAPSGSLTYTITVGNDGTDPVNSVPVRDFLPAGSTFVSATGTNMFNCVNNGPTSAGVQVDCSGGSIAAGGSSTITIEAFAPATPGGYTDQAIADPNNVIPEGNETNNTASVATTVAYGGGNAYIDLKTDAITQTILNPWTNNPEPSHVTPGGLFTYHVTVENLGTNPAFNVELRDVLPAGTTFASATDTVVAGSFTCSYSSGVVDCTGATINGTLATNPPAVPGIGSSRTVDITVRAPNRSGLTLSDTATVNPTNAIPEGDYTNNSASLQTSVLSNVDLSVTKTGPSTATQGQTATYDITVTNNGSDPATGVVVHDPLPVGLIPLAAFVDDTANNNFACQVSQNPINVVDCTGDLNGSNAIPSILPATKVVIHVKAFITASDGTTFTNQACVDPANTIVESNELNNCSSASTHVGHPDLAISKAAQSPTVSQGQSEVYSLVVSNQGDATTTQTVTVTDQLNAGLTYVSAVATNSFTCTYDSGTTTVTCTGASLAPGASSVITLTTTVNTSSGPIPNTANVSLDPAELNGGNNSASASVSINGVALDLVLTNQHDSPDPVSQGDAVTYTFSVANAGSVDATGVHITDTFSTLTGMNFVSATASQGFTCSLATTVVTCDGNLGAGQTTTVKIVFQTDSTAPSSVSSDMEVNPGHTLTESNYTNNSATEVTTITSATCTNCIDLVQDPMIALDTVPSGGTATFTTTVGNVGDKTTAPGPVTEEVDILGSFTGETYTASNGFTCATDVPDSTPGFYLIALCTGNLGAGQGTVITVSGTVTGSSGDQVFGFAQADPNNTIPEFNESNNGPVTGITTIQ